MELEDMNKWRSLLVKYFVEKEYGYQILTDKDYEMLGMLDSEANSIAQHIMKPLKEPANDRS